MKINSIYYLAFLILLLTGCSQDPSLKSPATDKIKVGVAQVITASGATQLKYSGTVEALQTIPLNFQVTGMIESVKVDAGDPVQKGQLLATLDGSDLRNIYSTALAKYNQAKDAYDRLKQVHEEGTLPEIKWVEMKTNLEQATSSLDLAKNNLDKCKLSAPISGVVGRRNIEPGKISLSLAGAAIELVSIDQVLIRIAVPENEVNKIEKGRKAGISVMAAGGTLFEGKVTSISPVADLISRTYTIKIQVDNPHHLLKPGMVCDVSLSPDSESEVLVIPYQSVSKDQEGNLYVFIVTPDRSKVKKQTVRVGQFRGAGIEITGGLTVGQTIVTSGIEKLSDNSLIEI